jgi:hypothetical protein
MRFTRQVKVDSPLGTDCPPVVSKNLATTSAKCGDMKTYFVLMLSLIVASASRAQLPYTQEQVIAYAKSIDVQALDPSLPSQRLEDWLQFGPPRAHIGYWIVADSCDLKDPEVPFPLCARISFYREGRNGNRYGEQGYLLVQVGNSKDGIVGRPQLFYPSIDVWEGMMVMTGGAERLSELPPLLDQPVVADGVQKLYQGIVAHHPIGIPAGAKLAAIRPYLSKRLAEQLQVAQECQDDYSRQHSKSGGISGPGWLKSGLFSGEGSHASPIDAAAHSKEKLNDGSFLVYVTLEPVEAVNDLGHGRRAFYGGYAWEVGARVISENGQFVVDDVRVFDRFPAEGPFHLLSASFTGCDGSHWTRLAATN